MAEIMSIMRLQSYNKQYNKQFISIDIEVSDMRKSEIVNKC